MQTIGQWLKQRCQGEHLTLREAAAKTGLSHGTIADVIKGNRPAPETLMRLAQAFGGGPNESLALEDNLLELAGYRTPRPRGEVTQPMARLIDKADQLNEPQLKIMTRFADFLMEIENKR